MAAVASARVRSEAADRAAAPDDAPVGRLPTCVLVVDDNEVNLRVGRSLCEVLGFSCAVARDGVEAVELAAKERFDLILMDICMPGMDGVEATRAIRALPGPQGRTPIIAVTANVEPAEVRSYRDAGMHCTVAKPVDIGKLFAAMEDALAASRGEEGPRH